MHTAMSCRHMYTFCLKKRLRILFMSLFSHSGARVSCTRCTATSASLKVCVCSHPGQLIQGARRGPAAVELNQGDSKTGFISRLDMADILVGTLKLFDLAFICTDLIRYSPHLLYYNGRCQDKYPDEDSILQ